MQVRDAMSERCVTVKRNDSLQTAAGKMRDEDIGMLLVEDESGKICGVVTDRDLAVRALARGLGPDQAVAPCVTEQLVSCRQEDRLEDALRLMEQEQVRRLLVCADSDRPIGVLAQADIARIMGRSELLAEVLQEISQPGGDHSQR